MVERAETTVTIVNRLGLHARPAMEFVDLASGFGSRVTLKRADDDAEPIDGKSIMQIMMLAATQGTELKILCEGDDADQACERLAEFVNAGFNEK